MLKKKPLRDKISRREFFKVSSAVIAGAYLSGISIEASEGLEVLTESKRASIRLDKGDFKLDMPLPKKSSYYLGVCYDGYATWDKELRVIDKLKEKGYKGTQCVIRWHLRKGCSTGCTIKFLEKNMFNF